MANLNVILIGLTLLAYSSASSYLFYPGYQGYYPTVYFQDFRYEPTNSGYTLWYKTYNGPTYEEVGIVPYTPSASSSLGDDASNPDTLGSTKDKHLKSRFPLKNRKVSPKLLGSLAG